MLQTVGEGGGGIGGQAGAADEGRGHLRDPGYASFTLLSRIFPVSVNELSHGVQGVTHSMRSRKRSTVAGKAAAADSSLTF